MMSVQGLALFVCLSVPPLVLLAHAAQGGNACLPTQHSHETRTALWPWTCHRHPAKVATAAVARPVTVTHHACAPRLSGAVSVRLASWWCLLAVWLDEARMVNGRMLPCREYLQ